MGFFEFCTTGGVKRPQERCNESGTINGAPYGAKTKEKPADTNRRDVVACTGSKNRDHIEQFCSHRAQPARVSFPHPARRFPRFLVTRTAAATELDIELAPLRGRDVDHLAGFASRRVRVRLSPDVAAVAAQICRALTEAV
jgi:hypothetical protein